MLQLQQQQLQHQQDHEQHQREQVQDNSSEENENQEEIILEGDGANTIMNPESVSRIISDGNSDSEDSECMKF